MDRRLLKALVAVPIALLLVVPFATHAFSVTTYTLDVGCETDGTHVAFVDLVFLGHYVHVLCPAGAHGAEQQISFSSSGSGVYVAKLLAGSNYRTDFSSFNPNSCERSGELLSSQGDAIVGWTLFSSHGCD